MLLTYIFSTGGVYRGSSVPATVPQKVPNVPKHSVFSGWLTRQLSQRKSRAVRLVEALESEDKAEADTAYKGHLQSSQQDTLIYRLSHHVSFSRQLCLLTQHLPCGTGGLCDVVWWLVPSSVRWRPQAWHGESLGTRPPSAYKEECLVSSCHWGFRPCWSRLLLCGT